MNLGSSIRRQGSILAVCSIRRQCSILGVSSIRVECSILVVCSILDEPSFLLVVELATSLVPYVQHDDEQWVSPICGEMSSMLRNFLRRTCGTDA